MRSPYDVLQVSPQACDAVIRAAYRCLVQQFHPDRNPSGDAGERLAEINQAYALLADPMRRARYDQKAGVVRMEKRGTGARPQAAPPRAFVFRKLA